MAANFLTSSQQQAMDTVLNQMDIDDPSADVDKSTVLGDVAPRAVQKQEKQRKDKKEKKEKRSKSADDGELLTKKRKQVVVNGAVAVEGEKKKRKKKSRIE